MAGCESYSSTHSSVLLNDDEWDWGSLFVACLTSKQQQQQQQQSAGVYQGRIYSDNCTCCHTETEVADQILYLTQSQYTDAGPTSPSADPVTPGVWQGSQWSTDFVVTGMIQAGKISPAKAVIEPRSAALGEDALPLDQRGNQTGGRKKYEVKPTLLCAIVCGLNDEQCRNFLGLRVCSDL